MFAARCLLLQATLTAVVLHVAASGQPPQHLEAELVAGGLNEPQALSNILRDVGLHSIVDVQHLNAPEQLELSESLRAAGVDLGSRSRLRRLSDGVADLPTAGPSLHESVQPVRPCGGGGTLQPRRAQAKEGAVEADARDGGELSMDTLALMSTAVLGIATFVLQARVAKNAEVVQKDLEQIRVEQEQGRELATLQLERVRRQMGEVYRPVQQLWNHAETCVVYMQHELGFEFNDVWDFEFVRPFVLWPHVEVLARDWSPKFLAAHKGSPYKKYSPADIALLEDPAKRQLYIEAHVGCIAPRWREITAIMSTKSALMEPPPPSHLDGVYAHAGVDWTKFSGGTLSFHLVDIGAFAHAWAPLERRWEAGGVPLFHSTRCHNYTCEGPASHNSILVLPTLCESQADDVSTPLADFSRMQPEQPNPWHIMAVIFVKMISAAGAKEVELQGASSVVRRNVAMEALHGET
jgi:hypothetical protein